MFKFDTCNDAWLRMNIEDCRSLLNAYILRKHVPCSICHDHLCSARHKNYLTGSPCVWYVMTGWRCPQTQATIVTNPRLRRNRIQQLRRWIKAMELELERRKDA